VVTYSTASNSFSWRQTRLRILVLARKGEEAVNSGTCISAWTREFWLGARRYGRF